MEVEDQFGAARSPGSARRVAGEYDEVFISESGANPAKLSPVPGVEVCRLPGAAKGMVQFVDGWDDPMTDEEVEAWLFGEEDPLISTSETDERHV